MRKKRIIFVLIAVFVLSAFICLYSQECKVINQKSVKVINANNAGYETYQNQKLGISFSKPKDWNVFVDGGTIVVMPSYAGSSKIFLYPILKAHPQMKALSFIRFMYDETKKVYPDLQILDKRSDKKDAIAAVTASYSDSNKKVKGFYLVSLNEGRGIFCGYEDEAGAFDPNCTTLREVLKNLNIKPMDFYNATSKGQFYGDKNAPFGKMGPTIDINKFVTKAGVDGTMYIACPPDWNVGGGNYVFISASPDEKMGVWTTNDHQPKTFDPQSYFMQCLMPFFQCVGTSITKAEPNHDYMKMLKSQGVPSNAVNFHGQTTNKNGMKVNYAALVSASSLQSYGAPGGFVTTLGFYATPDLFERNFNVLFAMAMSITADNAKIMGTLRQNLARLDQASKTISATGDVVIQGLRQGAANTNRAFDKYNYYLSGEEARYSPSENKIYVVDSNLADYAGNPNYPNEILTSVPDNLWDKLPHLRDYTL